MPVSTDLPIECMCVLHFNGAVLSNEYCIEQYS